MVRKCIILPLMTTVWLMGQTRIIPHLTRPGGGFETQLFLENATSQDQPITLDPFDGDGRPLGSATQIVPAGENWTGAVTDLLPSASAYFTIGAESPVRVLVSHQVATGPGSPAHVSETDQASLRWRVFPGNWDIVFDGIAMVNLGDQTASLTIRHHRFDGSLIAEVNAVPDFPSGSKRLYVIGSPSGSAFDAIPNGYFDVEADQPVALTALRGTPPGAATGYLWVNHATPLPATEPPPNTVSGQWVSRGVGGGGALFQPALSPHREGELFLACDMSELFHSTDMGQSWQPIPFQAFQANPLTKVQFTADPQRLYAIDVTGDRQTPVTSSDGGQNWQALNGDPTDREAYTLEADPTSSNRLVLSSYDQVYLSVDGGASFSTIHSDTTDNGAFIAGSWFDGDLIIIALNAGLLVSEDGGSQFNLVQPIGNDEAIVSFTAARSGEVTRLFAVTLGSGDVYPGVTGADAFTYRGIYRMDWGAGPWTSVTQGIASGHYPFFVASSHDNPQTAYVGGASDDAAPIIYKTENGGESWVSVLETINNGNIRTGWSGDGGDEPWWYPEYVLGLDVHPSDPDVVVFTDLGFAHTTRDGGQTWQQLYVEDGLSNPMGQRTPRGLSYRGNGLENTSVWWLCWTDPSHIFAAFTDIGGIRSTDGGQSWSFDYSGHDLNSMYYVMQHPVSGTLYGATSSVHDMYQSPWLDDESIDPGTGEILSSTDHGKNWQLIRDFGHPVIWLAADPTQPNRLYASVIHSTEGGIYRTDNIQAGSGASWSRTSSPPRTEGHPFNIHVLNDGSLVCTYSGRRNAGQFTGSSGVFTSTDGGSSWSDVSHSGMLYWTKDLLIDTHDVSQNTWYVGVWSGWGGPPNDLGGIYRTRDRGASWVRIRDFQRASSIAIDPTDPDFAYVTTETDGLWFTQDLNAGTPLFQQDNDYPFRQPERIFFNPHNPREVWACSFGNGLRVKTREVRP